MYTDNTTALCSMGRWTGIAAVSLRHAPNSAAICAGKRAELLAAHRQWAQSARPGSGSGWVPPEAAGAAADHAERHASWECPTCTLVNGPGAGSCEACGTARQAFNGAGASASDTAAVNAQLVQEALLADAAGDIGNGSGGHSGEPAAKAQQKGKGPKKQPKFERLRVTGGDASATADWLDATGIQKRAPQNAWGTLATGSSRTGAGGPSPVPQPKSSAVWGSSGTAARDRVARDAWSKR
jgi:hypothetical protein